jgi:hypothetical protein
MAQQAGQWTGSRAGSPVSLYVSLCLPQFVTLHLSGVSVAFTFSTIVSNCNNEHANHLQNWYVRVYLCTYIEHHLVSFVARDLPVHLPIENRTISVV